MEVMRSSFLNTKKLPLACAKRELMWCYIKTLTLRQTLDSLRERQQSQVTGVFDTPGQVALLLLGETGTVSWLDTSLLVDELFQTTHIGV